MALTATPDIAGLSVSNQPLSQEELRKMDAYWRAANYRSVGQIYLYANPLLREPLKLEHVKPRLLGHWGTTPGLNFIYVHCNRVIKKFDLDVIYVCGPGHGVPGMVANTYLEGTYTELYSHIQQNEEGLRKAATLDTVVKCGLRLAANWNFLASNSIGPPMRNLLLTRTSRLWIRRS